MFLVDTVIVIDFFLIIRPFPNHLGAVIMIISFSHVYSRKF